MCQQAGLTPPAWRADAIIGFITMWLKTGRVEGMCVGMCVREGEKARERVN